MIQQKVVWSLAKYFFYTKNMKSKGKKYSGRRKKKPHKDVSILPGNRWLLLQKMHLLRHKSSRSCFDTRIRDCGDVQSWIICSVACFKFAVALVQAQSEPARTLQKSIAFILQFRKKNSCRFYQQEKVWNCSCWGNPGKSRRWVGN